MSRFALASTALGVMAFTAGIWGQVAEHPVLLALSKTDHTLSIVDPVTLKIIAKMPVGPDPHEVIASADGTRAWVSNMLGNQGHELDVLDLVNHKALPSIDTAPMVGLHGLDFQGGKVCAAKYRFTPQPDFGEHLVLMCASALFTGLTERECTEIISCGRARTFARDQLLYAQGQPANDLIFLQSGRVKHTQLNANGEEVLLWMFGSGEALNLQTEATSCGHSCSARDGAMQSNGVGL